MALNEPKLVDCVTSSLPSFSSGMVVRVDLTTFSKLGSLTFCENLHLRQFQTPYNRAYLREPAH